MNVSKASPESSKNGLFKADHLTKCLFKGPQKRVEKLKGSGEKRKREKWSEAGKKQRGRVEREGGKREKREMRRKRKVWREQRKWRRGYLGMKINRAEKTS